MSADEVHLVLSNVLEASELYQLRRIYLPNGKIGGKPQWLDPIRVPTAADAKCEVCGKPMAFVVQIYAPNQKFPESAFHRYLYVFVCRNGECSQPNKSANLKVLRSQLPRKNSFFGFDKPLDPNLDGEIEDPFHDPEKFAHLCNTCGLKATSKCAKCSQVRGLSSFVFGVLQTWYCSRDHQIIDWTSGHRQKCGKTVEERAEELQTDDPKMFAVSELSTVPPENSFLFREYGIKTAVDYGSNVLANEEFESDDEIEDEEANESKDFEQKQHEELKKLVAEMQIKNQNEDIKDADLLESLDERVDHAYKRFCCLNQRRPSQLIRYALGAQPLSATDYSPVPSLHDNLTNPKLMVPNCERCGSKRVFELQLMPHLLTLMEVDAPGASVDWATVFIYTCERSCDLNNAGFTFEFAWKQDFVVADNEANEPISKKDEQDLDACAVDS
ncbi:VMA21-like domain protein [Aphelenchoides besseyi]|nr:VMA21-like domain protein [Aphelenchoides besseyi]KAI6209144.1 VMA21-like domain protein [Aphelenchoides besseyi]